MPDNAGVTWASDLDGGSPDLIPDTLKSRTMPELGDQDHDYKSEAHVPISHTQSADSISKLGRPANRTSTASLKALSERNYTGSVDSIRRALSNKSSHGQMRGRKPSQSKIAAPKRQVNSDHPVYPDQSFASLQAQFNRPGSPLRTRSSHAAQNIVYNDLARRSKDRSPLQGAVTADNTPISSPSLFTFPANNLPSIDTLEPQLHHLQAPKETHTAEIEHDTFSGNKFINNYEIVHELGRGEYGKVKLARNIETAALVAVKIVPRYSRNRRLGRLGAPEDQTKREVAILKKARHAHVVSLLEVIDDPSKNKVYLILEYIERGEIKWRKSGVREVVAVNHTRYDQERAGATVTPDVSERDLFTVAQAQRRHEALERARLTNLGVPNWSLEHGGDDDEDERLSELSRSASRHFDSLNPSRTHSHDDMADPDAALAGSMYGSYAPEIHRGRAFSVAMSAVSHMSSEVNFGNEDDEDSFVPAMTLEEARRAFRDTLLGLEFLHFIGIIHRDIKPANLLVASNGAVKISDFGVSYFGRTMADEHPDNKLTEKDVSPLDNEKELARSVGTPAFWAPEVCYEDTSVFSDGAPPKIGTALDLWALGITLYCMIYARLPFDFRNGRGLHESICHDPVFMPKTRLVPVDTSADKPSLMVNHPINSNKRLDYELKFEVIPAEVRDLISRLLEKDPSRRMTILEAKKHPWVVQDMVDPSQWIRGPDLEKEGKGRILEIDEKEMSHAVVKRNIIERALTTAGRIAGNLLGRRDARKRASSAATSSSRSTESVTPPAGSNASTIGKSDKIRDSRRTSLKSDELVTALKASRDIADHHPLAQSQTASPDVEEQSYFNQSISKTKSASLGCTPSSEQDSRPKGPDRTISSVSAADSVNTIRASQFQRQPLPELAPETTIAEVGLTSKVDGLWEGTTKAFARLASRDRRGVRGDRSPASSRNSSESNAHGDPSLAISTASATGAIQTPEALRHFESPVEYRVARSSDRAHSVVHAPESPDAAFEHAQALNQRKLIHEAEVQAAAAVATPPESHEAFECPPSPDDIIFLAKQQQSTEPGPMQAAPSASTIASSVGELGSVSQSTSNPSFGMRSSASSPPGDTFLSAEYKDLLHQGTADPPSMRTVDTITDHGQRTTVPGKALEDNFDAYDDDGDDEDDSEEEGIMMGAPKRR